MGPAGVAARMAEIQRRIDEKLGTPPFKDAPAPLAGAIGSAVRPMDPFGSLAVVQDNGMRDMVAKAAGDAGVDPRLLEALVSVESSFNPRAVSGAGALGLAQLMPGTARALGIQDPFDPEQSLVGGARYLKQMLSQFGDVRTALAAYNAGPGAVSRFQGIPPYPETRRYVERVLSAAQARGYTP